MADDHRIDRAVSTLKGRSRILVFTGAGISTESGIPDFRGPDGLWTKVDPASYTIENYLTDDEFRKMRWEQRFHSDPVIYRPNPAHQAVVDLWSSGSMIGCITQNIDGLHQAAGLPDRAIAELHGNAGGYACWDGGHSATAESLRRRWRAGDTDPRCERCGSIIKATVVMFGENLPEPVVAKATRWADDADAVIVVGSTLGVYPAALFPLDVASRGEPTIVINEGDTEHEGIATVRIRGKAGTILPALVERLIQAGGQGVPP